MRLPLLLLVSLASANPTQAETTCKSIETDSKRGNPSLYVKGERGAYSYTAYDGSKQVLALKCDTIQASPNNPIVCARVFRHSEGYTTDHYVIAKVADFTSLYISSLVENHTLSGVPGKHYGTFEQFTVECIRSPVSQ